MGQICPYSAKADLKSQSAHISGTCDYILLNAYYCMLFSSTVRVRIRIRFSVWLVSGYAHVLKLFFLLSLSLSRARRRWERGGWNEACWTATTSASETRVIAVQLQQPHPDNKRMRSSLTDCHHLWNGGGGVALKRLIVPLTTRRISEINRLARHRNDIAIALCACVRLACRVWRTAAPERTADLRRSRDRKNDDRLTFINISVSDS